MLEISRLLVVSVFAWSAVAQIRKKSGCQSENIAILQEYRQTAEEVSKNMNREIEPCDDFYQFSCGKFVESVQIHEGADYMDAYTHNSDTFTQQIRTILTEERAEADPNHSKLPNKFYKSCMNTKLLDELGDEPVRRISNSLGGWPVVVGDSWDSDNSWSWQDLAKKLRRIGFGSNYIMTFRVGNYVKNKTRNIFYFDKPTFVFKSDLNDISLEKYYDFMVDTAVSFGANKTAAIRELRKSLNFEMDLVDISEIDNNLNYLGNIFSIEELQEVYPYVQWLDFIQALLPESFTIDGNEIVNLILPSFFDKLDDLLARTEKRTIANYIMWKFHYLSMTFLSTEFRNKRQQFDSRVLGTQSQEERVKQCESIVSTSLPIATSSLYANNYFNQISKTTVTKIFENIQNAFSQTLDESQWLDGETKTEARRKLHSMKAIIGFPDELFDFGRLEEYYRELEIDENKYFQSYLNIRTFELDKEFRVLRMPRNETEWLKDVILSSGSAYNEIFKNKIYLPAGGVQGQYFKIQRPNYMNYGSIGFVLAHEVIHGFSGPGCKYCADGNGREWWQPASMYALSEREKCFIEQYSNYTDKQTGLKIDGLQTLQENIADNSGVKHSYLAYKQWRAKHGAEIELPGLKYTAQQLFWISFAQSFCGKFTTARMEHIINRGSHSPHEFRVLGVLRNMKDFSKDFHCPGNSPMNPLEKCEIW